MAEHLKTQNYMVMAICGGYFFFHLLYYLLSFWHLATREHFGVRAIVWEMLRPMFAVIGYGWHIITPLCPFVFDRDLIDSFPGQFVNRKRSEIRQATDQSRNEIDLTPTSTWSNNNGTGNTKQTADQENFTEFNNPVTIEDDREYNRPDLSSEA